MKEPSWMTDTRKVRKKEELKVRKKEELKVRKKEELKEELKACPSEVWKSPETFYPLGFLSIK